MLIALVIVLAMLKTFGVVSVGWVWVFSPFWIPAMVMSTVIYARAVRGVVVSVS